jgi:hypothetical protein
MSNDIAKTEQPKPVTKLPPIAVFAPGLDGASYVRVLPLEQNGKIISYNIEVRDGAKMATVNLGGEALLRLCAGALDYLDKADKI